MLERCVSLAGSVCSDYPSLPSAFVGRVWLAGPNLGYSKGRSAERSVAHVICDLGMLFL
jgi:hypothetical protein